MRGLNKAKSQRSISSILRNRNSNVPTFTTDNDILAHARDFYKKLYEAEHTHPTEQEWFLSQLQRRLPDITRDTVEGPLQISELTNAVKKLNLNKSPGPDGIPAEFYKKFWPLLKDDLLELYNYSYDYGQLSTMQEQATINLTGVSNPPETTSSTCS